MAEPVPVLGLTGCFYLVAGRTDPLSLPKHDDPSKKIKLEK